MATPKKKAAAKPSVKFRDLKTKKDPKGGAFDAFLKFDSTSIKFNKT